MDVKSLHSFPSMFLSGDSQEDTNGASSLSFFVLFFSGGFKPSFRCWSYFFSLVHMLSMLEVLTEDSYFFSPLAIQLFRSAEDISEDLCLHYQSVQAFSRLLSYSSHLIQPVQSFFSSNLFNGVYFEWALTHKSFSRILPDSSNFSRSYPQILSKLT